MTTVAAFVSSSTSESTPEMQNPPTQAFMSTGEAPDGIGTSVGGDATARMTCAITT